MARSAARLQTADEQRKFAIRSAVGGARRALSTGLQKALTDIGVLADGKRIPLAELPDPWGAAKVRPAIEAALDRWSARGYSLGETITRYVREATYTWLNRLAAIWALSAHGLIAPIGRLEESGRSPLLGALLEVAPVLQGAREIAEAALWQSVFEELAVLIGTIFDPLDPHGILFPGSIALGESATALSGLDNQQWRADDTLGWCYQFFTTKAERAALHTKKGASFTAEDLGPVNQFFTPRWVVQYLVDNTLGAVWRRMNTGSNIADFCSYLLPPTGVDLPLTLKRVRDIRIIDPACGAMHFGAYAFDVLVRMYAEEGIETACDIPRLILERNIAGIDIDRRAIQIAAINLYLKAAVSYQSTGDVPPADLRLNLACTDVAPPNADRVAALRSLIDDPLVRRGFDITIDALQLLPAVGSLLNLDRDVRVELTRGGHFDPNVPPVAPGLPGLLGQLGPYRDSETDILSAVVSQTRALAFNAFEREEPGDSLLASDVALAARSLCLLQDSYDVILMNPPYGESMPPSTKAYLQRHYPDSKSDLYSAFYELASALAVNGAAIGALTSKTFLYLDSFKHVRKLLVEDGRLTTLADCGDGILDEATVDVAAVVFFSEQPSDESQASIFRLLREDDRERALFTAIARLRCKGEPITDYTYVTMLRALRDLPTKTLAYWAPSAIANAYEHYPILEPGAGIVRQGLATGDDKRFLRFHWEVPSQNLGRSKRWAPFAKGGEYSPFYESMLRVIDWGAREELAKSGNNLPSRQYYFSEGLTYSRVSGRFHVKLLSQPAIFSDKSPIIIASQALSLLGYLNSKVAQILLMTQSPTRTFEVGQLRKLCVPDLTGALGLKLASIAQNAVVALERYATSDEVDRRFVRPSLENVPEKDLIAATEAAVRERHAVILQIKKAQDNATELVSAEMGFTSDDWKHIANAFGKDIRAEEHLRARGLGEKETRDALADPGEHVRRYLSGTMRKLLSIRAILRREKCVAEVYQEIAQRFTIGDTQTQAAQLLSVTVERWLDREFHRYHFLLYQKRPRIVRLAAGNDRIVVFIDALRATRDDIRALIGTELGPAAQRARADLASGLRGASRTIAEEMLADAERFREHFETIAGRWDEGADDIRPRIELLKPLAAYLTQ